MCLFVYIGHSSHSRVYENPLTLFDVEIYVIFNQN